MTVRQIRGYSHHWKWLHGPLAGADADHSATSHNRQWGQTGCTSTTRPTGQTGDHWKGLFDCDVARPTTELLWIAIRRNLVDLDAMATAIKAIFRHCSNDHNLCPKGEDSRCKFTDWDPSYKAKQIAPQVLVLMAPVVERLSDPDLLQRLQRGDSQNANKLLHSFIWGRSPNTSLDPLQQSRHWQLWPLFKRMLAMWVSSPF